MIKDQITKELFDAMGEPCPGKTYLQDGWIYRNLPWMEIRVWECFVDILGEDGYIPLCHSRIGSVIHSQILISPEGRKNLFNEGRVNEFKARHQLRNKNIRPSWITETD